jgi:phospholipid transport system substrate-binding protein
MKMFSRLKLSALALAIAAGSAVGPLSPMVSSAQAQTTAPAPAAAAAPDEFVNRLSNEVIEKIRADKDLQAGNIKRISEFVDATIMPQVNFERMTASAVGRGWRNATPEQQKALMTEFRILLLRTYAGALQSVKDQQVRLKPLRMNPTDTEVIVRSEVVSKRGGEPIALDYRLEKAGSAWKIYDMSVLGAWLVETYRGQFAQEINAGGVDGLIKSLTEKNKSFAAAALKS